jgi:hypothetical protein
MVGIGRAKAERGSFLDFFIWVEGTALSTWVRESPSILGFPFILYLHTLGLAMIAGLSSAIALSLLMLRSPPRAALWRHTFRLIWIGLGINVLSGLALLAAYPAKALTNPVFYAKMLAIAIAIGIVTWLERQLTSAARPDSGVVSTASAGLTGATALAGPTPAQRRAAVALLALWLVATVTGRLLAYTHSMLMARDAQLF